MTIDGLPLVPDATGEAVRDLQRRLAACGFGGRWAAGHFDTPTDAAVRSFQAARGLVADGVCGLDTWSALVEAGYHLGDRLLYRRSPMLRGDDVAELQRKLGALGFDAGRVDGILGPDTEKALKDFQRNTGLTSDGVCGPDVLAVFRRLGEKTAGPADVAGIRERDRLARSSRQLGDRRIVVGDLGGLDLAAAELARVLRLAGATTTMADHPDGSVQARQANAFDAELYVGLSLSTEGTPRASFYATEGFESVGGHYLAKLVVLELGSVFPTDAFVPMGMRLPILRETRMPAVVCHIPRVDQVVSRSPELAHAVARAIGRWVAEPVVG